MVRRTFFHSDFEQELERRISNMDGVKRSDSSVSSPKTVTLDVALPASTSSVPEAVIDPEARRNIQGTSSHRIWTPDGDIWISGNALLCSCPNCKVPMTIRIWLGLADCWKCATSIQLTEEQVQAARQLIAPVPEATPTPTDTATAIESLVEPAGDDEPNLVVPEAADARERELDRLTRSSATATLLRRGFNSIPAWLVSFLLHLILILLLALIVLGRQELPPTITLSTFLRPDKAEGGEIRIDDPKDTLVDDLAMANDLDIDDQELRDVLQQAERDAEELRVDRAPLAPLPDLDSVKQNITTRRDKLMSFAARDPRVRADIVHREGGTSLTEAAVSRGLRWLASVQNQDGSWSLANYDRHGRPDNQGDAAATSLALLPFLGAGQTHEYGKYKQTVAKGLAWLLDHQLPSGDLRADFPGEAGMYAHGQAAIVLCEALAMTGDERFRLPAQRAVDFIESAQHIQGGWRYRPKQPGDTSMVGWQLMALQSARAPNVGLRVNADTLRLADNFLSDVAHQRSVAGMPAGSLYKYQPGRSRPTPTMTAEALLCRMYLGWQRNDPRMMAGIQWLVNEHPPSYREKNIYYWYYATQVMHHFGGRAWDIWNRKIREILVATQTKKGSRAGSWSPRNYEWGSQGGRIYVTSLSVCTLEVYYRHLPLFKQIDFETTD